MNPAEDAPACLVCKGTGRNTLGYLRSDEPLADLCLWCRSGASMQRLSLMRAQGWCDRDKERLKDIAWDMNAPAAWKAAIDAGEATP